MLFKNCSNLSLNYSGAYLHNSELMLPSSGLLPFFVNILARWSMRLLPSVATTQQA